MNCQKSDRQGLILAQVIKEILAVLTGRVPLFLLSKCGPVTLWAFCCWLHLYNRRVRSRNSSTSRKKNDEGTRLMLKVFYNWILYICKTSPWFVPDRRTRHRNLLLNFRLHKKMLKLSSNEEDGRVEMGKQIDYLNV